MLQLASWLLAIVFVSQLVEFIGSSRLSEFAYSAYLTIVPSQERQLRQLKKETAQTKDEFRKTSSQDEFAKWARLRRKLDKQAEQIENLSSLVQTKRSKFTATFRTLLWLITTLVPFAFTSYHKATPVLFLPPQWLGPTTYWLSFPFTPYGAISCTVFVMSCKRFTRLLHRTISELVVV